jgi:hypothetical protein
MSVLHKGSMNVLYLINDLNCVLKYLPSIYLIDLEIKDTTDTARSALYLNLHLEMHSEDRLKTKLYDKRYMISIFPLGTFDLYVATFQQHMNTEFELTIFLFALIAAMELGTNYTNIMMKQLYQTMKV